MVFLEVILHPNHPRQGEPGSLGIAYDCLTSVFLVPRCSEPAGYRKTLNGDDVLIVPELHLGRNGIQRFSMEN